MMKKEVIYDKEGFDKAVQLFVKWKPVKVHRELKDEFFTAIQNYFIESGASGWGATIYPLVKSYKFKRTS